LFALYNCLQIEMQVMHMVAYPSYRQMTLVLQNYGTPVVQQETQNTY
jgi:hypothetical protein